MKLAPGAAALLQDAATNNPDKKSSKDGGDAIAFDTVLKDGFLGIDCVKD